MFRALGFRVSGFRASGFKAQCFRVLRIRASVLCNVRLCRALPHRFCNYSKPKNLEPD